MSKNLVKVTYREGEFQEAVDHVLDREYARKNTMSLRKSQGIVRDLIQVLQDPNITGTCSHGVYVSSDEYDPAFDKERIVDIYFVPDCDHGRWRSYDPNKPRANKRKR